MNFDILQVLVYSGASLMIHLYRSRSSQGGEGASLGVFFVGKEGKGECLMVIGVRVKRAERMPYSAGSGPAIEN